MRTHDDRIIEIADMFLSGVYFDAHMAPPRLRILSSFGEGEVGEITAMRVGSFGRRWVCVRTDSGEYWKRPEEVIVEGDLPETVEVVRGDSWATWEAWQRAKCAPDLSPEMEVAKVTRSDNTHFWVTFGGQRLRFERRQAKVDTPEVDLVAAVRPTDRRLMYVLESEGWRVG